jgi:glycosyltransferase involved in cell wall biosynthesis
MNDPLVSVIVPVYNGAAYLAEALASVRGQTYDPVELIIVDDGSQDASPEIAASYRPTQLARQEHQGVAVARNQGLALSTGLLVAFLDQDDWWEPDKLERQVEYLRAQPAVDYVTTRQRLFLSPGAGTPLWLKPELLEGDQPGTTPSTLLARKALFERLGTFDPQYAMTSDVEWFLRAKGAGVNMHELPAVLTHKRVHGGNHSRLAQAHNEELVQPARPPQPASERQRGAGDSA